MATVTIVTRLNRIACSRTRRSVARSQSSCAAISVATAVAIVATHSSASAAGHSVLVIRQTSEVTTAKAATPERPISARDNRTTSRHG